MIQLSVAVSIFHISKTRMWFFKCENFPNNCGFWYVWSNVCLFLGLKSSFYNFYLVFLLTMIIFLVSMFIKLFGLIILLLLLSEIDQSWFDASPNKLENTLFLSFGIQELFLWLNMWLKWFEISSILCVVFLLFDLMICIIYPV